MNTKKHSKPLNRAVKKRASSKVSRRTKSASTAKRVSNPEILEKNPNVKICEEVEIGDIGGFGSPEELEAHEERCTQEATTFCTACSKNLCSNHYEFLHWDHNASSQRSGQALTP